MNHTSCQFRDKHTVGGIVFYKHAFLVLFTSEVLGVYISLTGYPDGQQKVSIDQEHVQCEPKSMAEWFRALIFHYHA